VEREKEEEQQRVKRNTEAEALCSHQLVALRAQQQRNRAQQERNKTDIKKKKENRNYIKGKDKKRKEKASWSPFSRL